jgi:hypothetical protein
MAFRTANIATGESTSPAVASTGVVSGDIVLLRYCMDQADRTPTWPTGFTQLGIVNLTGADGGHCAFAWKRAGGSEPGTYTITTNAVSTPDWVCQCSIYSGRHATDPPVASTLSESDPAGGAASPITATANGVTAVGADDLDYWVGPDYQPTGAWNVYTAPSTYTTPANGTGEIQFAALGTSYKENVSAGATGSVAGSFTLTSGTAGYGAWVTRIPAVAGAATSILKQVAEHYYS